MKQKITIKTQRFVKQLDTPTNQLWFIETIDNKELPFFTNNQEGLDRVNSLKANYTYLVDLGKNNKGEYIKAFIDFADVKEKTTNNKDIPIGLMSLIKANVKLNQNEREVCLRELIIEAEREYIELKGRWC